MSIHDNDNDLLVGFCLVPPSLKLKYIAQNYRKYTVSFFDNFLEGRGDSKVVKTFLEVKSYILPI